MTLLSSNGPEKCGKCGRDWLGLAKCECGWRPDAGAHRLRIASVVAVVAFIAAGFYLVPHWYEYFPNNAQADEHLAKGDDELNRQNSSGAIREYKEAVQYSPTRADLHRKLADAFFAEQSVSEALKQCEIAYKLAPHDKDVVDAYAAVLGVQNEWKQGAHVLETFYTANPKEFTEKAKLAAFYMNGENFDEAERLLKEITAAQPTVGNGPWVKLYEVYDHKKDKKAAVETLRTALRHLPQDSFLQETLGVELLESGQKKEAVKELTRATQLEPSLAQRNSELISSAGSDAASAPKEFVIPLKHEPQGWVADVILNGTQRARMLVDTGAETCCISVEMAKKLGLTGMSGKRAVVSGAVGMAMSRAVVLDSVQVGGAKEFLVQTVLLPNSPGVDGLLGMTFLNRYQVSLDTKKNALSLKR
jgi:clan AA aspartic protease (TIGR02281 family)